MFFSTVTLRFAPDTGSFDDASFDEFSKGKEVLSVREHFFEHGGLPHLLLCVSWRMTEAGSARKPKPSEDWKQALRTPEHQDRFDRVRRWRNETAKKEGLPAYAILTNRQAAEVAVLPAPTLGSLQTVDGLGPARAEKWGRSILGALGAEVPEPADG